MGLALVDANNCYDWIAHPMASMVFQAFGVPTGPIRPMLTMLQEMRFFLWTGYGDSTGFVGGNKGFSITAVKNQGIGQGNSASPAAWTAVSIPMISAHKRKGHGAHLVMPISNQPCHLGGGSSWTIPTCFTLTCNGSSLLPTCMSTSRRW
jgi:hypothetical protein